MKLYLASPLQAEECKLITKDSRDNYLLSYYYYLLDDSTKKVVYKYPDLPILIDSGAHSLFNRFFSVTGGKRTEKGTHRRSYRFLESDLFRKYLWEYVKFLKVHDGRFEGYVTLDVIFNEKETLRIQEELEQAGLKPIPVYHYGEPNSILEHYVDNYEYIGIGGLGQFVTKELFVEHMDKNVMPVVQNTKVRLHGFAMTSPDLLVRYPWYSVDSATWIFQGAHGNIYMPKKTDDGYDFLNSRSIHVTHKGGPNGKIKHISKLTSDELDWLKEWLRHCGIGTDVNKFISCCLVDDVLDEIRSPLDVYCNRIRLNYFYFRGLERQLNEMGK